MKNPSSPSPARPPGQAFLAAEEIALRLGLSLRSVRRLLASGALPAHRFGRAVRVAEPDLARYLDRTRS